jgi:hypothetical protein
MGLMKMLNPSDRNVRLFAGILAVGLIDGVQLSYRSGIGFGGRLGEPSLYFALISVAALLLLITGRVVPELLWRSPLLRKEFYCLAAWNGMLAVLSLPGLAAPIVDFLYALGALIAIYSVIEVWRAEAIEQQPLESIPSA